MKKALIHFWQSVVDRPWILPIGVALALYWQLPRLYFEQDEWVVFGDAIVHAGQSVNRCLLIQRPLACYLNAVEIRLFGLNAAMYGLLNLGLLIAILLLFYRLLRLWRIEPLIAGLISALVPVLSSGNQAITWFGSASAGLPSYLFSLLTLNAFFADVKQPNRRLKLLTLVSLVIALYFKEEALWLIPVMFFGLFLYPAATKPSFQRSVNHILLPVMLTLLFLSLEKLRHNGDAAVASLLVTTNQAQYVKDVLLTLVFYPLAHIGQSIIMPSSVAALAVMAKWPVIRLSYFLTALFLTISGFIIYRQSDPHRRQLMTWLVLWIFFGYSAYAVFGKNPDFIESRYFFPSQFPLAALLILLLPGRSLSPLRLRSVVGLVVIGAIFAVNLRYELIRLHNSVAIGTERKQIINTIKHFSPTLPSQAIVLAESTNPGYAGSPVPILPFQGGLGYILSVLYQGQGANYQPFIAQQFLWGWLDQGYKRIGTTGFGYFWDYRGFEDAIIKNQLPLDSIRAFRYEGTKLVDISSVVQERIFALRLPLKPITHTGWTITSNDQPGVDQNHGIAKAIDADQHSDWNTAQTAGKYLQIDLGQSVTGVAGVSLLTADGNSYPRRYRFDYSSDGKIWQTGVADLGRPEGLTLKILFKPKTIRAFRITQTETKPIAFSWSVADISVLKVEP